ncbi:GT2 family glycosyltransferase [Flavobacterium sp. 90]|uniref:glycosyltransferase n=1 Tax=unclassified Flavobacterium TaxID=196869 RepID=UPI000EB40914|nr:MULTISPECIES: glycosyltransferase [unclassified Flavobacterium]RKR08678.1 GT2 family glycosyltransferase [Flavobacterium sp. 81]TCK52465.1 GT2 family glycosyltransferase [Flavobacterium sp. 90]
MLSILIPTYNYNVVPLVLILKEQADSLGIVYEILTQDDVSQYFITENNQINLLPNCSFSTNTENLGRGKNINLLCAKSKYEYTLILEADALPENDDYLKNYIEALSESTKVIFGGVKYPDAIPSKEKLLRWKYGKNRETKSINHRLKNTYDFVFTWNLLLKKEILLQFPFPEFIHEYGYEDFIFIENLRLNSVPVIHIENYLIHHNGESSADFIRKSERASRNLYDLVELHKIDPKSIRLSNFYERLKKLHLIPIVKAIYKTTKKQIIANLTSNNPSLYLLDFYKLGYYANLKK